MRPPLLQIMHSHSGKAILCSCLYLNPSGSKIHQHTLAFCSSLSLYLFLSLSNVPPPSCFIQHRTSQQSKQRVHHMLLFLSLVGCVPPPPPSHTHTPGVKVFQGWLLLCLVDPWLRLSLTIQSTPPNQHSITPPSVLRETAGLKPLREDGSRSHAILNTFCPRSSAVWLKVMDVQWNTGRCCGIRMLLQRPSVLFFPLNPDVALRQSSRTEEEEGMFQWRLEGLQWSTHSTEGFLGLGGRDCEWITTSREPCPFRLNSNLHLFTTKSALTLPFAPTASPSLWYLWPDFLL